MRSSAITYYFLLGVSCAVTCCNCKTEKRTMVVDDDNHPTHKLPDVCAPVGRMTAGEYAAKLAKERGEAPCPEGTRRVEKKTNDETEEWCEREDGTREGIYRKVTRLYTKDIEYHQGVATTETTVLYNVDGRLFREILCDNINRTCTERSFYGCGTPAEFSMSVNEAQTGMEVHWETNGMIERMITFSHGLPNGPFLAMSIDGWRISTGFLGNNDGSLGNTRYYGPAFEWLLPGCGFEKVCKSDSPACHLCTGEYEDGKRMGTWTEWAANGRKKLAIYEYEDGKLVKEKKLD